MFKESKIIRYFHLLEIAFILLTIIILIFVGPAKSLLYLLLIWIILLTITSLYRYRIYRRVYSHFQTLLMKTGGTIFKGSYFFSVPPSFKFRHSDHLCYIATSIDPKFDLMIEFICQIEKEIELRISRPQLKPGQKNQRILLEQCIINGIDANTDDGILENPHVKLIIEDMMQKFMHLYFGKDGQLVLVQPYDSSLTSPKEVFTIFDQMVKLANLIKNRE